MSRLRRVSLRAVAALASAAVLVAFALLLLLPRIELERGKDPGLGVRALHAQGFTGAGVDVAIVDGKLRTDHVEYAARLVHYEELDDVAELPFDMHGPAMASLLVGRRVGAAPGARLHYFAADFASMTPERLAAAIDHVVERNEGLPAGGRVRLLSISIGFPGEERAVVDAAIERALDANLFVLVTTFPVDVVDPPLAIRTFGCSPWRDCDRPANFAASPAEIASWRERGETMDEVIRRRAMSDAEAGLATLYVPGHHRTVAGPRHARHYAFSVEGGDSEWAPYLSGVLALALEVAPDLHATDLAALLAQGVSEPADGVRLVDPARVVALARTR
jgi:hypothetical protein